jgi:hypothetical protein
MSLIDFPINLTEAVKQLTRIADALDRAYPIPTLESLRPIEVAQLSDLKVIDSEADQRQRQSHDNLALRFGVVPGSPAFEEALAAYERQHQAFYRGKGEEPLVINWEEAFEAAATGATEKSPDKPKSD